MRPIKSNVLVQNTSNNVSYAPPILRPPPQLAPQLNPIGVNNRPTGPTFNNQYAQQQQNTNTYYPRGMHLYNNHRFPPPTLGLAPPGLAPPNSAPPVSAWL